MAKRELQVILPPRTMVTLSVRPHRLLLSKGDSVLFVQDDIVSYQCIDCGYDTAVLDDIVDHQAHGKHSWVQRYRRWRAQEKPRLVVKEITLDS